MSCKFNLGTFPDAGRYKRLVRREALIKLHCVEGSTSASFCLEDSELYFQ